MHPTLGPNAGEDSQVNPPAPGRGVGFYASFAAAAVIALLIMNRAHLSSLVRGKPPSPQTTTEVPFEQQEAIRVTAAELLSAYEGDRAAADSRFKGKKVEVRGLVVLVSAASSDDAPIVQIGPVAGPLTRAVMLSGIPRREVEGLARGAEIVTVCKGEGRLVDAPLLGHCRLESVSARRGR